MIYEASATILIPGAATSVDAYIGSCLRGRVHAIKYEPGTLNTLAMLVITGETTGVAIMSKDGAGTSTVWYYPRAFANQIPDITAESIAQEDIYVLNERIKVAVTKVVAADTGTITAYIDGPP